jgi:hypothetical protein
MTIIYAPNIYLFAFQLYKASNLNKKLEKQEIKLWLTADKLVKETLNQSSQITSNIVDNFHEPQGLRVPLKKNYQDGGISSINLEYKIPENNQNPDPGISIRGFAYPFRIDDSYGLFLNLSALEKESDNNQNRTKHIDIDLLSTLKPQNCFKYQPSDEYFLGQTLLITAWITPEDKKNQTKPYDIAQKYLNAISLKPEFNRQGKLFGSPIFEYGLLSQLDNYQHVIIWLFDDEKAEEKLNRCYQQLLDLFFFRSKVIKAYQRSRIIYQNIAAAYDQIENTIQQIKSNTESNNLTTEILNNLTNTLKDLSEKSLEYTHLLRNLKDYQNTIDIHSNNYQEKLRQISAATQDDNLSILETFYEHNCERFYKQINADIGYFEQGLTLLEQATASIRGIVEIEQTKRDRNLNTTINTLGIGFGGGAIISGVVVQHIDKINQPLDLNLSFNKPLHPFYASLFISIAATLSLCLISWLFFRRK